jgi:hypothetical protein
VKETSYLTDQASLTDLARIATTIGNYLLAIFLSPAPAAGAYASAMKLCQGQIWKKEGQFIRVVRLERLEVEYKSLASLATKTGTLQVTSKKDFCRLLKGAHLLSPEKRTLPERGSAGASPAK